MTQSRYSTRPALLLVILAFIAAIDAAHGFNETQSISFLPSKPSLTTLIRSKRLAVPAKPKHLIGKEYQECIAPGSKPGHCKHPANCEYDTYRTSFPRMVEYMCIIENQFIGVCCPDDATQDGKNSILPVGGIAGSLPAVATDNTENEDRFGKDAEENETHRVPRARRSCGDNAWPYQDRVAGGRPTSTREYPWIAALLRKAEDRLHQFCGGVLITDRHILTAAHCVHRVKPREITVRLGEYDLRYPNETRALDFSVAEIRIHKGYVATLYKHDIAILKLTKPTPFNSYIWPICLPPVGTVFEHKNATVIGWGTTEFGGASSYVLLQVEVPVWSSEVCKTKFVHEITSNHICAAIYEGHGDACQGDSGGPLLHQLSNKRWVVIGVVSWGIGCGLPDKPGIYTRVNAYLDWIFANSIF